MATSYILSIEPQAQYIFTTTLCTYIYSIIQIQSISLQNIINYSTDTNVRRYLICSNIWSACTWKIVFKTQNNELNELSECMLHIMFCFFGKYLKTVKLSFTIYFPEALLAYFALKVYKNFINPLLSYFKSF